LDRAAELGAYLVVVLLQECYDAAVVHVGDSMRLRIQIPWRHICLSFDRFDKILAQRDRFQLSSVQLFRFPKLDRQEDSP